MRQLRVGMAQINTTVGDFAGNTQKIIKAIAEAKSLGVDLLTFPELAVCGYPPEDLLLKPQFIEENLKSVDQIVKQSSRIAIVVGFVDAKEDIYNAAAVKVGIEVESIAWGGMVDCEQMTNFPEL